MGRHRYTFLPDIWRSCEGIENWRARWRCCAMAPGTSLEPRSAEGWAALVQSEARARGRQSARSAWVVTARETLSLAATYPREARLTRVRARCTGPYWSGLCHLTHEPYGTAVDTRWLHNHHTWTLLYIVPRWAGTGIRFYQTSDGARRESRTDARGEGAARWPPAVRWSLPARRGGPPQFSRRRVRVSLACGRGGGSTFYRCMTSLKFQLKLKFMKFHEISRCCFRFHWNLSTIFVNDYP